MFDFLNVPIGYVIDFCYKLIPNYALALLLFALIMKIVLFPLGIKQQKNTVKQAKLRPKEQAIRKRYAGRNDKVTQQKMNEEIMKLYQEENFNPAGGCLPMILQLVILLALYGVITNPLQYVAHIDKDAITNVGIETVIAYHQGKLDTETLSEADKTALETAAKKIVDNEDGTFDYDEVTNPFIQQVDLARVLRNQPDLSLFVGESEATGKTLLPADFTSEDLPDFTIFGGKFDLSRTPAFKSFDWLMAIPILTLLFTFLSMKLTKKLTYQPQAATGDAAVSMKLMDYMMPLMSTYFTFHVPAVIAVYWIYQQVFSTLQQLVLKLMYPYPNFTEEDYKAAEREMNKGVKMSNRAKKREAKRAAHRIDLDDEETDVEATDDAPTTKAPAKRDPGMIPPAALKDESDKPTDNG